MNEECRIGLLCTRLAGTLYGIRITHPVKLLENLRLEALPCVPPNILGITNIRRGVAVVCDGHGLLCSDDGQQGTQPVLITTDKDSLVVLFDAVHDFIHCCAEDIRTLDPPLQAGQLSLSEALPTERGTIYLIDPEQLMDAVRSLLAD